MLQQDTESSKRHSCKTAHVGGDSLEGKAAKRQRERGTFQRIMFWLKGAQLLRDEDTHTHTTTSDRILGTQSYHTNAA